MSSSIFLAPNGPGNRLGLSVSNLVLNQDFRDLLILMSDEGAHFLLIGGWALALHGHGRGTDDMDVVNRIIGSAFGGGKAVGLYHRRHLSRY